MTGAEMIQAFRVEVGEATEMVDDATILRWVNEGQDTLSLPLEKDVVVEWDDDTDEVELPEDFERLHGEVFGQPDAFEVPDEELFPDEDVYPGGKEHLKPRGMPPFRVWGRKLIFLTPGGPRIWGLARVLYFARWPKISFFGGSDLPQGGDRACLSYALYRFFDKVASSRTDFTRYAQLVGANGVEVNELRALADAKREEFDQIREELQREYDDLPPEYVFSDAKPASFYGD